ARGAIGVPDAVAKRAQLRLRLALLGQVADRADGPSGPSLLVEGHLALVHDDALLARRPHDPVLEHVALPALAQNRRQRRLDALAIGGMDALLPFLCGGRTRADDAIRLFGSGEVVGDEVAHPASGAGDALRLREVGGALPHAGLVTFAFERERD